LEFEAQSPTWWKWKFSTKYSPKQQSNLFYWDNKNLAFANPQFFQIFNSFDYDMKQQQKISSKLTLLLTPYFANTKKNKFKTKEEIESIKVWKASHLYHKYIFSFITYKINFWFWRFLYICWSHIWLKWSKTVNFGIKNSLLFYFF